MIQAGHRWRRVGLVLAVLGALSALALLALAVAPLPERLQTRDSVLVQYADGSPAHVFLGADDRWRIGVTADQIDPRYLEALLRYEDKRFFQHPGVDPVAVLRAAWLNLRRGQVVSGASTLTMQVVRILEPRPRTLVSKVIEAVRALQLELRMSKSEILETYLRFAPLGRNIEGVGAAALAYFGHGVEALAPAEIAVLLAVPQDPSQRYPSPAHQERLQKAVLEVATRLHHQGLFSDADLGEVQRTPVPEALRPFPRAAPHASIWLSGRTPDQARILTTLRPSLQHKVERLMAGRRDELIELGIHNGVAVVVDVDAAEVVALVGNFDFWDQDHHGQVPGFVARRSPGSALKPFIYALAIDRGLVLPGFMIEDTPVRFGNYAPKNYDERFRGLVRMDEALSLSLNVPFVNLLKQIGVEGFLSFLQDNGVEQLGEELGRYGLSVAIGAVELSPLQLTDLYAMLARGGLYRRARLLQNASGRAPGLKAFGSGAAYLTRQGLRGRDRPDFPARSDYVELAPEIFWKTGTSYGHRDAWALGSDGRYAVGIWLGNFDGKPSRALVGGHRAGPLLFDVLDALQNRAFDDDAGEPVPEELVEIEVCALSGRLPVKACPHRRSALAPLAHVPTERCGLHQAVHVDDETGHALCPLCRAGRSYSHQTFTILPTEVRRWVSDQHLLAHLPPAHLPDCQQVLSRSAPVIAQPQKGTVLYVIPGLPLADQEFPAEARVDPREREVHWFVDGALLKKARPDERVWIEPRSGTMEIRVVDSSGRSAQVKVLVRASALAANRVRPAPTWK